MTQTHPEEQWAASMIAVALGAQVTQHDDGSAPSMYDLNLAGQDGPFGGVEVTAAADADSIQLWKLVNGKEERWIELDLLGGWMVTLEPTARAKRLLPEMPALLRELEGAGRTVVERSWHRTEVDAYALRARDLGIVHADRSPTDFPGSIYVTIERARDRTGGAVDAEGNQVPLGLEVPSRAAAGRLAQEVGPVRPL